jgi:hypothetical protein
MTADKVDPGPGEPVDLPVVVPVGREGVAAGQPLTARSATFSPTGPAPMTTTS